MRRELVLPPLSAALLGRPYASVPLLAAYAEQSVGARFGQRDLNRDVFVAVARRGGLPQAAGDADPAARADAVLREAMLEDVARGRATPDAVAAVARDPAVRQWMFAACGLAPEDRPESLTRSIERSRRRSLLDAVYDECLADAPVADVVGISIPFNTQLVPALVLARLIRERSGGRSVVVAGGPLMSLLADEQIEELLATSAFDGVAQHEGERAVAAMGARDELPRHELAQVPGVATLDDDGRLVRGPAAARTRLQDTRPHDFDAGYVENAVELPVMVGRGCVYDCSFCDYVSLYQHVNFRPVDDVVEVARRTVESTGIRRLHLVYEVLTLTYQRRLAAALAEADLGVSWRGFQRVFGEMTGEDVDLLERSGCRRLDVGLEAADDATLRLMNKGYTRREIAAFFEAFAGSSIQLLVNIIVDYPGLDHATALDAVDFLEDVTRDVPDVHFELMRYSLSFNSEMHANPERFGLRVLDGDGGSRGRMLSPTTREFETDNQMSASQAAEVEARFRAINAGKQRRIAERAARRVRELLDAGAGTARCTVAPYPFATAVDATAGAPVLYVRNLYNQETFEAPEALAPAIVWAARSPRREERVAAVAEDVASLDLGVPTQEVVEELVWLGMLRFVPERRGRRVRPALSSDRNFYRGVSRPAPPLPAT